MTNPTLLKECKLWRESFPHIRVRGTKIDLKRSKGEREQEGEREEKEDGDENDEKSVQTLENHLKLNNIEKKREKIKTKVVDELVERLIAKFNLKKQNGLQDVEQSSKWENVQNGGVEITEITTTSSDLQSPSSNNNNNKENDSSFKTENDNDDDNNVNINNGHDDGDGGGGDDVDDDDNKLNDKKIMGIINENKIVLPNGDRESYYERGKSSTSGNDEKNVEDIEKRLCEIFDSWEMDDVHNSEANRDGGGDDDGDGDGDDDDDRDFLVGKKKFDKKNDEFIKSPENNIFDVKKLIANSRRRDYDLSDFDLKVPVGETIGLKPDKKSVSSKKSKYVDGRFSDDVIKPFEMTRKIDKRYEGLLTSILEKRNVFVGNSKKKNYGSGKHQRNTARENSSGGDTNESYRAHLEKIRKSSGFDELYKRSRSNLPKINNKNNYWLERGEIHARDTSQNDLMRLKKFREMTGKRETGTKTTKMTKMYDFDDDDDNDDVYYHDRGDYQRNSYYVEYDDDKLLRDFKREMGCVYKRPPMTKMGGGLEKINLNRPKPFGLSSLSTTSFLPGEYVRNSTYKSTSSCGDSPEGTFKNVQKTKKNKTYKGGKDGGRGEKETFGKCKNSTNSNVGRSKSQNFSRNRTIKEHSGILPPIESSEYEWEDE